MLSWVIKIN